MPTDTPPTFTIRKASDTDHTDILAVLEEVASEIPVLLDTSARLEAMKSIIVECCATGDSLVAVDSTETIVGFVLAKPDTLERFYHENGAISLRYVGVGKQSRQQGIFAALMDELLSQRVPVTAEVLHTNQSNMSDRLTSLGYEVTEADDKQTKLRWTPGN